MAWVMTLGSGSGSPSFLWKITLAPYFSPKRGWLLSARPSLSPEKQIHSSSLFEQGVEMDDFGLYRSSIIDSGLFLLNWSAAQQALRSSSHALHHCFALSGVVHWGHCGWSYLTSHLHDRARQMALSLYWFIYSITCHPRKGLKQRKSHEFCPQENSFEKQFLVLKHGFIYLLSNHYGAPTAMHCPRHWRDMNVQSRPSPWRQRAYILGERQKVSP